VLAVFCHDGRAHNQLRACLCISLDQPTTTTIAIFNPLCFGTPSQGRPTASKSQVPCLAITAASTCRLVGPLDLSSKFPVRTIVPLPGEAEAHVPFAIPRHAQLHLHPRPVFPTRPVRFSRVLRSDVPRVQREIRFQAA
jgi:hypothetical protein